MKIKVRTKEVHFSIPVPVSMAGAALRLIPESVFEKWRSETPEPYRNLITKDTIGRITEECVDILKENKGLEVIHVEARDGTFVSVRL